MWKHTTLHSGESTGCRHLLSLTAINQNPLYKLEVKAGIFSSLKCSPEQKGMGVLHIPLSWHIREDSPFNCLPPKQEYRTVEPNVNFSPVSTPLGGEPGWPQSTTTHQDRLTMKDCCLVQNDKITNTGKFIYKPMHSGRGLSHCPVGWQVSTGDPNR